MDRRHQRIDEFLKYLASIAIYNPDIQITRDIVYGELVRIGINQLDRGYQISNNFNYWIDRFKDTQNIEVFNKESWRYFCQFINGDIVNERTHIKMYIPLNKETIVQGANMLFDFMAANNIAHHSKIGSALRNDAVVVRVASFEDANAVANFVNSNEFIKNSLIEANPFMLNDGNIGYATDANLSYSGQTSDYIASYINSLDRSQLGTVNIQNFSDYVKKQYNEVFENGNSQTFSNFEQQHNFTNLPFDKKITKMANCCQVTKLLLYSLSEENRLDRVGQIYTELLDQGSMKKIEDNLYNKYNHVGENINNDTVIDTVVDKEAVLKNAIFLTFEKYGYEHAKKALMKLANFNDSIGITRDYGARNAVKQHLTNLDVQQIIANTVGSVNFDLYMDRTIERRSIEYKESILENASIETLKKYGLRQLEYALDHAFKGNFSSFTNTNDCRNQLIRNVEPHEIPILIQDMLTNSNITLQGYAISDFATLIQSRLQEFKPGEK